MKLISWNIAGKVNIAADQVDVLLERQPDIIALQEVRGKAIPILTEMLSQFGLKDIRTTCDLAMQVKRNYAVLIASRWPFSPKIFEVAPTEFAERILAVEINTPFGKLDCYTTHIPPGSQYGWVKICVFEWLYNQLAKRSENHRILCGDFNSPRAEFPDGTIVTWGQRLSKAGSPVIRKGFERWDKGERRVLSGLAEYDLPEVYRLLNGWEIQEASWKRQVWGQQYGYRFDHVFASRSLRPKACQYLHALRENGFSDHSPIEVELG